jgi:hypothetical protein
MNPYKNRLKYDSDNYKIPMISEIDMDLYRKCYVENSCKKRNKKAESPCR